LFIDPLDRRESGGVAESDGKPSAACVPEITVQTARMMLQGNLDQDLLLQTGECRFAARPAIAH
jgi:hypothetical protein